MKSEKILLQNLYMLSHVALYILGQKNNNCLNFQANLFYATRIINDLNNVHSYSQESKSSINFTKMSTAMQALVYENSSTTK